jgi:hypothetical protein
MGVMTNFYNNAQTLVTYETAFVVLSTIVNVFFFLYFIGFLKNKNALVETVSFYLKLFIGLFLAIKFNPFYTFSTTGSKFTNLDKKIVFSAGMYILIINGIVLYSHYYKSKEDTKNVGTDSESA